MVLLLVIVIRHGFENQLRFKVLSFGLFRMVETAKMASILMQQDRRPIDGPIAAHDLSNCLYDAIKPTFICDK